MSIKDNQRVTSIEIAVLAGLAGIRIWEMGQMYAAAVMIILGRIFLFTWLVVDFFIYFLNNLIWSYYKLTVKLSYKFRPWFGFYTPSKLQIGEKI